MSNTKKLLEILQDAENLVAPMENAGLPRVHRSINQMLNDCDQLWNRISKDVGSRDQAEVQSAILLGSRGFDLPKLTNRVNKLSTARAAGLQETIQPTDIDGFLRNVRQNALTSAIAEHSERTDEDVDEFIFRAQNERWNQQKKNILSSIEFTADTNSDQRFQSINETLSMNNVMMMRNRDTFMRTPGAPMGYLSNEERKYARALAERNLDFYSGATLAESTTLIDKMAQVAEQLELKEVVLLWQLLQDLRIRHQEAEKDRLVLIHSARRFLEKKHLKDLRATVYGNLNKAALGGVPGTAQLIRAYLNVRPVARVTPDEPMVHDHPVWVFLYHALRCGDFTCAREVALQAGLADLAGKFQECQRSSQQLLGDRSVQEIRLRYINEFGIELNSGNPYERVVYAILGGCDIWNDHSPVGTACAEDYFWIKLYKALVAPSVGTMADALTLGMLQAHVTSDYGEGHFDAVQRPLQFAYLLLLTAQFETAIEFLFRTDAHRCHSVHMAMALDEFGMIRKTVLPVDPMLVREGDKCAINLVRLVTAYTRRFEMEEPELALEYYVALKGTSEKIWLQCVIELALETRAFAKLLGQRSPDGGIVVGALEKFLSSPTLGPQARNRVTAAVAEAAEARGFNEDAIALYELADEPTKCLELLTKVLSTQVTQAGPEGSRRAKLQRIAQQVSVRYSSGSLNLLLDLMTFFDFYHARKNEEALELASRFQIVPLHPNDVEPMVTTFCGLSEQIRRVIPELLVALMTILCEQYKAVKRPTQNGLNFIPRLGGEVEAKINLIKRQANALIKFAGMVPYRLPANVNVRLVQMEANMA